MTSVMKNLETSGDTIGSPFLFTAHMVIQLTSPKQRKYRSFQGPSQKLAVSMNAFFANLRYLGFAETRGFALRTAGHAGLVKLRILQEQSGIATR